MAYVAVKSSLWILKFSMHEDTQSPNIKPRDTPTKWLYGHWLVCSIQWH